MASDAIILLPWEIIVHILEDTQLGFTDVINFGSTCTTFNKIINSSNNLWRAKFFQKWPLLEQIYLTEVYPILPVKTVINWKDEVKIGLETRRKLLDLLFAMSSKHYMERELCWSVFKEYDPLFRPEQGAYPLAYHFLVDELINFIQSPAIASNLTHRYYAFQVIRYLRQSRLKDEWSKFISMSPTQQTLERAATFVAQWSQPERHISYSTISLTLDSIAMLTKELLKEQNPTHPIFSTPKETLDSWKNNIVDDNQWSIPETRQIIDALRVVLFEKLGFCGNTEMYYSSENSFIDRVLIYRRGIPITLEIVFESVARRLGILCEPVSFPSHFLLRWKESYGPESANAESFYVDVFNGGRFITKKNCPKIGSVARCPIEKYNVYEAANAVEVVTKMANSLVVAARQHTYARTVRLRSALELLCMVQPRDTDALSQLTRLYTSQQMDITEFLKDVQKMGLVMYDFLTVENYKHTIHPEFVRPNKRFPSIKYAVGLIMKHKIHGYLCVITGWSACCEDSSLEMEMVYEGDEDDLNEHEEQPFYNILVNNGSYYYATQDNLMLAANPEWIKNHAIGRFFEKYNDTHYLPNEETRRRYPEDEEVRNQLLLTQMLSGYMTCKKYMSMGT
ncbi:F-box only protein 21-like [Ceratina calcarata]|uniref:F-box only protein 21-like n=1 Tax=Ceratina calcarata TaxID=156304 RepID=A0AAJ7N849_9HYME|nr:F-box only protein 21-like [Ceratina calcarata]